MFETLYVRPAALARHRAGPLAAARTQFLAHCATQGYSRTELRKIARRLLVIARSLPVRTGPVSMVAIERAAGRHAARRDVATGPATAPRFIRLARRWLQFLGRLSPAAPRRGQLAQAVDAFAHTMREDRGLSPVTIAHRCRHIEHCLAAVCSRGRGLRQLSLAQIDHYLVQRRQQGYSRRSMAALASSLRSFFRYTEAQRWSPAGMAAAIDMPRLYAREDLPVGPTWAQVQQLIASTAGDRPADIRDRAIVLLLALYGLRRGEVARLHLDDLDWGGEVLRGVRPKQQRIQYYPLIRPVGEAIIRYLRAVRPPCAFRELFLALRPPRRPLSAASITPIIHARLAALGVPLPHRGPHSLRHACAQHLLTQGFSLKQIGDQLGHRHLSTTLLYTKIDLDALRAVAELDLRRLQ